MKSNKFKTLKLLIIFIIIIIIATFALIYVKELFIEKENDDIKTNMLIIQAKIKLLKGEADVNQNEDGYVGIKVSDSDNQEIKELIQNLNISENEFESYYILYKEDFEKMGISEEVKNIEDNDYIINYNDTEVIYTKGITIDGVLYYKLSDIIAKEQPPKWILYNRIGD